MNALADRFREVRPAPRRVLADAVAVDFGRDDGGFPRLSRDTLKIVVRRLERLQAERRAKADAMTNQTMCAHADAIATGIGVAINDVLSLAGGLP